MYLPYGVVSNSSRATLGFVRGRRGVFLIASLARAFRGFFLHQVGAALALGGLDSGYTNLVYSLDLCTLGIVRVYGLRAARRELGKLSMVDDSYRKGYSSASSVRKVIRNGSLVVYVSIACVYVFLDYFWDAFSYFYAAINGRYLTRFAYLCRLHAYFSGQLVMVWIKGVRRLVGLVFWYFVVSQVIVSREVCDGAYYGVRVFLSLKVVWVASLSLFGGGEGAVVDIGSALFKFLRLFVRIRYGVSPHLLSRSRCRCLYLWESPTMDYRRFFHRKCKLYWHLLR